MKSFQQKSGWRNILHSRPVLAVLGILVLVFAYGVIGFMGKMTVTKENKKIAENKVAELEKQKEKLSVDIDKLKTGEGVEESIREKFGLAKEGEGVIVIVEDENTAELEKKDKGGFFSFFTNWFK